jgi:hypothetical protein
MLAIFALARRTCLTWARLISDRRGAENLQALAADYIARAERLERMTVVPDDPATDGTQN